jgi:hypothetical protein
MRVSGLISDVGSAPRAARLKASLRTLLLVISSRHGLLTLLLFGCAVTLFYSLDWLWLRQLQVNTLAALLGVFGHSVLAQGFELKTGTAWVTITPECTYVDWILCASPFLWRFGKPLSANLSRLAFLAATVSVVNLIRTLVPILVSANGGSWFWAHDLVDYLLWYPGLAAVILFWLCALMRTEQLKLGKEVHAR